MTEPDRNEPLASEKGPPAARFRVWALPIWLPACVLVGAAVAWLAAWAGQHRAPLVLFPLLVGGVLGATLVGLMRLVQVGHRPTVLLGTLLAAAVAVAGQHYAAYGQARASLEKDVATFRLAKKAFGNQVLGHMPAAPEGIGDYLREEAARGRPLWGDRVARGAAAWATWAADGLLLAAAALAVVVPAGRQPYCDRCHSWFRTTRRGKLDAQAAAGVAAAAGIDADAGLVSARYRLVTCSAGCNVVGFVLSWQQNDGQWTSATRWLDAEGRIEVVRRLDAGTRVQSG